MSNLHSQNAGNEVAIVGFACRFPKSSNADEFWRNLEQGIDCIEDIPKSRWNNDLYYDEEPGKLLKTYCKKGGFIPDVETFDNEYFGLSDEFTKIMDPRQKLLLTVTLEALEHSGCREKLRGTRTGVFVGTNFNYHSEELPIEKAMSQEGMLGNGSAILAHKISNFYDFTGPSFVIDSYCSSSLMGVHLARMSILNGDCDAAVVAGAHILSYLHYISLGQFRAHSHDGKCKSFNSIADGYVSGEGVGVVILKPLEKALKDGDEICAVIKGSCINHSGGKFPIGSHNAEVQEQLISDSLKRAGIDPETITYIEANSAGIDISDIIEIKALKGAFSKADNRRAYCALGSVKTNIGDLAASSGIAGLIKVLLCMEHRKIAGNLHFEELNKHIDLVNSPFYISNSTSKWEGVNGVLRAGISSFNFTGAYSQVVLEKNIGMVTSLSSEGDNQSSVNNKLMIDGKFNAESYLENATRGLLLTLVKEALRIIVCTKNMNHSNEEYKSGVVDRYQSLKKMKVSLEQTEADNFVVNANDILKNLYAVLKCKGVCNDELNSQMDALLNKLNQNTVSKFNVVN